MILIPLNTEILRLPCDVDAWLTLLNLYCSVDSGKLKFCLYTFLPDMDYCF